MSAPRRASGAQEIEQHDEPENSPPLVSRQPQGLKCATCGGPGSAPTVCSPAATSEHTLLPIFVGDGKVELLCGRCRRGRS